MKRGRSIHYTRRNIYIIFPLEAMLMRSALDRSETETTTLSTPPDLPFLEFPFLTTTDILTFILTNICGRT